MTIKQTSKIQYILLVLIILFNPIIVSADVLFTDISDSLVTSTMDIGAEMLISCHDETSLNSTQPANEKADCCETPCDCSATGCQVTPATFIKNNNSVQLTLSYTLIYLRDHYLSFVSSPSFPPPIA